MEQLEIRVLRPEDDETSMALIRRVVTAMRAVGFMQWDDIYPNIDVVRHDIAAGTAYGAWVGGALAGVVTVDGNQSREYAPVPFEFGGPTMTVHRLAVDPAMQRRGISARLMDFAEALALEKGSVAMRLDTCEDNTAACGLYFGRGYIQRGTCHFPRRTFTFLVMEKKLR